jgi:hypothetical protein
MVACFEFFSWDDLFVATVQVWCLPFLVGEIYVSVQLRTEYLDVAGVVFWNGEICLYI